MAGRNSAEGTKRSRSVRARRRRRLQGAAGLGVVGMGVGGFAAAAAMMAGPVITAAPAKADVLDFLDPIIQQAMSAVTDSVGAIDPTLGTDLTSWTDTALAGLNSLDSATAASSAAEAAASSTALSPTSGTYELPITFPVNDPTEPVVQATVDGSNTTLLVDTGSSGLVIPYTDLGSNYFQQLENLLQLGFPTGISSGAYSSGIDYVYLEYNNVPVDYATTTGTDLDTSTPVDVEIYSYNPSDLTSYFTNDAFQNFDSGNGITGVLGIGDSADDAGPGTSPFQDAGFNGVTVDLPSYQPELIVSDINAFKYPFEVTVNGAPITNGVTEKVMDGTTTVGTATVNDDVDSGGVFGTIPSSLAGEVQAGDTISAYDSAGQLLYSYPVTGLPDSTTDTTIDSGVGPYLQEPIFIDYSNDTLTFDRP